MKPSQPIYWCQSDCPTVVLSPRKISEQSQASSSKKVTPTSPGPPPVSRKISRHTMPATRHWIATTGLSGTIHGRATAVSFWPSGHWVAVGFSIGIVQVSFSKILFRAKHLKYLSSHTEVVLLNFCVFKSNCRFCVTKCPPSQ